MIDYLHRHADEAAAMAALSAFVVDGAEGPVWDLSCALPGVAVYRPDGFGVIDAPEATRRAAVLDETLQANQNRIDDYEAELAKRPDRRCDLTPDDLRGVLGSP